MATAGTFLSEDQFLCSICLDVFTEPVSTPCGHNFCKACISKHWEGKELCKCPLCNENFSKELKLCVNSGFREVVENFLKHHRRADSHSPLKPGQVSCDCCPGDSFKAVKTCLVCLTSFCKAHLEPHQRVAALKRHKLTNPVRNLEDKICKTHNRILDLFCRTDLMRVCSLCTEHSAHDTIPLEESYVNKKAQVGKKKAGIQDIRNKRGEKANNSTREDVDEASTNSVGSNVIQVPYIWLPEEGPHQFSRYLYAPGHMAISRGKFYYEVGTTGMCGWFIGVVRKSNLRKQKFRLNTRSGSWVLSLQNDNQYSALHDVPVSFVMPNKPERVILFVDYDNGLLSFYDADTQTLIYTFTGCKFKEPLFLFCAVTEKEKKIPLVVLVIVLIAFFLISLLQN